MAKVCLACILGIAATSSWAQAPAGPPVARPPQAEAQPERSDLLEGIVRDLASDDVVLRIDAQRRLTEASGLALRDIEALARRPGLTAEQRQRLESAAYTRFCAEPRGGMGVQSMMGAGERGIVLQAVVPGFPSAEVLRVGDRLLSVDGHLINDISMMRPVVISRDPGDEIPVVVVRSGTTLNLKVRLGRFSDLNQRDSYRLTPDILDEAWQLRALSFAGKGAEPAIESGLPAASWQVIATQEVGMDFNDGGDPNLDSRFRIDTRRLQNPEPGDSGLVAAGEARGAGMQIRWAAQQGVAPTMRVMPGADGVIGIAPGLAPDARDARAEIERIRAQRVTVIRQEQATLREEIERLRVQLKTADDEKKKELVERIASRQRRIEDLERLAQPPRIMEP